MGDVKACWTVFEVNGELEAKTPRGGDVSAEEDCAILCMLPSSSRRCRGPSFLLSALHCTMTLKLAVSKGGRWRCGDFGSLHQPRRSIPLSPAPPVWTRSIPSFRLSHPSVQTSKALPRAVVDKLIIGRDEA